MVSLQCNATPSSLLKGYGTPYDNLHLIFPACLSQVELIFHHGIYLQTYPHPLHMPVGLGATVLRSRGFWAGCLEREAGPGGWMPGGEGGD